MQVSQSPDFLAFWQLYPRKVGKLTAIRAYSRAISNGAVPDDIFAGVQRYREEIASEGTESRFIAHPSSWLNAGRWMDEVEIFTPMTAEDGAEIKWRLAVKSWKSSGYWPEVHGPKPGQPGCKCPAKFLMESAA